MTRLPRMGGWVCGGMAVLVGAAHAGHSHTPSQTARLVDVRSVDRTIRVELSYNSPHNAFGRRFYKSNTALLREPVARRLAKAQAALRKRGLGLKVWDAYRPTSVQRALWNARPDARRKYLTHPRKGSKHSRGAAVDVTLVDASGRELKMPTPHDEFSPRAHRGALRGVNSMARRNARILERAMRSAGFIPNRYEWWHFSARDWARFPIADASQ